MENETDNQFEKEITELREALIKAMPEGTDEATAAIAALMVASEAHARLHDPNMLAFLSLATAVYQLQLGEKAKTVDVLAADDKE